MPTVALTGKQVIDLARRQISDSVADSKGKFRWPGDTAMMPYVNLSVREIVRRHPEAKYFATVDTSDVVDQTDPNKPLSIGEDWLMPAMFLTSSLALGEDSEDTNNSQISRKQFDLFERALLS